MRWMSWPITGRPVINAGKLRCPENNCFWTSTNNCCPSFCKIKMAKNCGNKVKHTCGTLHFATCTRYEGSVNTQSELEGESSLDLEQTTPDI